MKTDRPLAADDPVWWLKKAPGGIAYPGRIVRIGPHRITIEVKTKSGELVRRAVHPDRIRRR